MRICNGKRLWEDVQIVIGTELLFLQPDSWLWKWRERSKPWSLERGGFADSNSGFSHEKLQVWLCFMVCVMMPQSVSYTCWGLWDLCDRLCSKWLCLLVFLASSCWCSWQETLKPLSYYGPPTFSLNLCVPNLRFRLVFHCFP